MQVPPVLKNIVMKALYVKMYIHAYLQSIFQLNNLYKDQYLFCTWFTPSSSNFWDACSQWISVLTINISLNIFN
jgi:hypothetical protein